MMVHREIAGKHVPREAYPVSRRHRSDALILSCASLSTNDASQARSATPPLPQKAREPCVLGEPCVSLKQVKHGLVDKPVTCD